MAGERFTAGRTVDPAVMGGALNLLGPLALGAATLDELSGGLPARAEWVLAGITSPADLWRAERAWLARVEQDGLRLLRTSSLDSGVVLGAVAVMGCDAGGPGERSRSPPGAGRRRRPTMSWLDAAVPVRMKRVALVAADESLRDMLVRVADAAAVEIGPAGGDAVTSGPASDQPATGGETVLGGQAGRRLQRAGHPVAAAALAASRPDLDALEQAGRYELLAGEAQLEAYAADRRQALRGQRPGRVDPGRPAGRGVGQPGRGGLLGGPAPLPARDGSAHAGGGRPLRRSLSPLVQTYGTVPYADIDPTWLAWGAYVLMFGMMFGDAGEGVALIAVAAALRAGWPRLGAPVPAGVAVRRGCRGGGHRVRPAVRGMLRAHRSGADAMARPAG